MAPPRALGVVLIPTLAQSAQLFITIYSMVAPWIRHQPRVQNEMLSDEEGCVAFSWSP